LRRLNVCVAVVDNQLCGFELKFRRKMFTHEVTYRVGEVRISPSIRWPVSVCHYKGQLPSSFNAI
ncbi:hypothetical protein, partial [Sodalis sp. (in: enterobacteria)]|uniref:hypothetical protein n=1 Tax=Sodalis sp. (in: enterobacteria) TaxID=1898979 RepID=UPI003F381475